MAIPMLQLAEIPRICQAHNLKLEGSNLTPCKQIISYFSYLIQLQPMGAAPFCVKYQKRSHFAIFFIFAH